MIFAGTTTLEGLIQGQLDFQPCTSRTPLMHCPQTVYVHQIQFAAVP